MAFAENITVHPAMRRAAETIAIPARSSRLRRRHVVTLASLICLVLVPALVTAWYLWAKSADQYASTVAFSVRSEEPRSGLELLGGIADISSVGANDSDILYDYLHSLQLIQEIQKDIDLAAIWSKPTGDPIFAFEKYGSTAEDLQDYWSRMVHVSHDAGRGIIEVRTHAFDPADATRINALILDVSTKLINDINTISRDDAVRYALEDLQRARVQLSNARRELTEFRILHEILDPSIEAEMKTSLISSLEMRLTETLVEIEILSTNTHAGDSRLGQAQTRAEVLEKRIAAERRRHTFGAQGSSASGSAEIFGDYEKLVVEVRFAEEHYQSARAGFDLTLSEARRTTRYLAAHVLPTTAEKSLYPRRSTIFGVVLGGLFLIWSVLVLIGFSILDRR